MGNESANAAICGLRPVAVPSWISAERENTVTERRLIAIQGVVQGVGFRPYVHRLAASRGLRGSVRNDHAGVTIDVEGDAAHLDDFLQTLTLRPPPLASIASVNITRAAPRSYAAFRIEKSEPRVTGVAPLVPADVATCADCVRELFDPANRRFRHPFITCTQCGPRLTVVRETPYDRERTAMAAFAMCADCRREYEDPGDRRFHAEAIACHACGPTLRARTGAADATEVAGRAALDAAVAALRDGQIVAIKALGGYHIACDATSEIATARLRARKQRPAKPLAIMVRDAEAVQRLCAVSADELALLESAACPIVLLECRSDARVAPSVAPGQRTLGVMLPSTPLHHLLLAELDRPLVMTSGNRSGEPVLTSDAAAASALGGIVDLFLTHDRPITVRCDDSVARSDAGDVRMLRRSRGYVPRSLPLGIPTPVPLLAMGAHLKSTVCLAHEARAVLSPHVGDLDSWEGRVALREAIDGMLRIAGVAPQVIAHDLHPEYASTQVGQALAGELGVRDRVAVQHHHAHVAACLAEHQERGPVIGVAFDGSGLGTDGAIWGGEFLVVDGVSFERRGHLAYAPLPGGDAAARRPWRSAAAHLARSGTGAERPPGVDESEWEGVQQMLARRERLPQTSSVGRLFDAVASLLGLRHVATFEGEAGMALEAIADMRTSRRYPLSISSGAPWTADPGELVCGVRDDRVNGRPVPEIAGAFHLTLRDLVVSGCARIRDETGIETVVLTGGVFMNAPLLSATRDALVTAGFRPLIPGLVPCNDGGIALGQAYVAAHAMREGACA